MQDAAAEENANAAAAAAADAASRNMTSAIAGITVPCVRKALNEIRQLWARNSAAEVFRPSDNLVQDLTIEQFAFLFVLGQHNKRHHKSRRTSAASRPVS